MQASKNKIKHIVCFSGGHSSAIVAIEVARRYGAENTILLNHDINPNYEDLDIKRFKKDIASFLNLDITYANAGEYIPSQFEVSIKKKAFKIPGMNDGLCTSTLKTEPFYRYIEDNHKMGEFIVYYGYDDTPKELNRVCKKIDHCKEINFLFDAPLALWGYKQEGLFKKSKAEIYNTHRLKFDWLRFGRKTGLSFDEFINNNPITHQLDTNSIYERTIFNTEEVGIKRPKVYEVYSHANCKGCLKGGIQHWYVTYCRERHIFDKAKETEAIIGHSILSNQSGKGGKRPYFLSELEPIFESMKRVGVPSNEHYRDFKQYLKIHSLPNIKSKSCVCTI